MHGFWINTDDFCEAEIVSENPVGVEPVINRIICVAAFQTAGTQIEQIEGKDSPHTWFFG